MPRKEAPAVPVVETVLREASMRPGHCAPERGRTPRPALCARLGFNEAGALCPGKSSPDSPSAASISRFNEAGALCPGKSSRSWFLVPRERGFNEAGALCPGKRANPVRHRPPAGVGFNEAGALCPGKRPRARSVPRAPARASMRPGHCAPERGRGASAARQELVELQ